MMLSLALSRHRTDDGRRIDHQPSLLRLTLLLVTYLSSARAQGDYTCQTQSDCAVWANAKLSANSQCVADPRSYDKTKFPSGPYGYCGYVGATCTTNLDCDYGTCGSSGKCKGYLGDACTTSSDCMGYFLCGTDGTCGGKGSGCLNGGDSCTSYTCDTTVIPPNAPDGVKGTCTAPPTAGVAVGQACGTNSVCASGVCDTSYLCAESKTATTPTTGGGSVGASQAAARNRKRNLHDRDPFSYQYHLRSPVSSKCKKGLTACSTSPSASTFECVDTMRDLSMCGGCLPGYGDRNGSSGFGVDCTALPGVDEVTCEQGFCNIGRCADGYALDAGGFACLSTTRAPR